jgi:hypothetical protein
LGNYGLARAHPAHDVQNDRRRLVPLSTFGFVADGYLRVRLSNVSLAIGGGNLDDSIVIGLTLGRRSNMGGGDVSDYERVQTTTTQCPLTPKECASSVRT